MKKLNLNINMNDPFIKEKAKKVIFLDIETSLVSAYTFRTGNQYIGANQLTSRTKILTVSYASLYDLETKPMAKAVKGVGNHQFDTFSADPLDDEAVLDHIWHVLDEADVIVGHNISFDIKWLRGRFLELGWPLTSPFRTYCTYRSLNKVNLTSKKLDELAQSMVGTRKLTTNFQLWVDCSKGNEKAFKEMLKYNKGDVGETLYKVWKRTAFYGTNPIDFRNKHSDDIQCLYDGQALEILEETYTNPTNGNEYQIYHNPRSNIYYRDRYILGSKKEAQGFIVRMY